MNIRWFVIGAIVAAVIQSTALGKIIYDRAKLLQNGREVVLRTGMVDPRDLFRGHFVTLNLTIGRIAAKDVESVGEFKRGQEVYVMLKSGGEDGFWIPEKIYATQPKIADMPIIRGKLRSAPRKNNNAGNFSIEFPVNRFFAEKKRAKELEKVRRDRNLGIVVALSEDGSAAIKGVSVEGELIYSEPIF